MSRTFARYLNSLPNWSTRFDSLKSSSNAFTFNDSSVCSSSSSEMPLWFVSCQRRRCVKILSRSSISLSPLPPLAGLSNSANARKPFLLLAAGCGVKSPNNSEPVSTVPLPLRSSASQASSEPAMVQPRRSLVPFPFRSKSTPSIAAVSAMPSPLISITIGEPPQVSQPRHVQVVKSNSPLKRIHRLAKLALQPAEPEKQHRPDPFGVVRSGQTPRMGTEQLPPAVAPRLHEKNSAFESRQRLPPVTVELAEAINRLTDTLAVVSQLDPNRHDENATPVAAAQGIVVPTAPVRFSVFRSFEPTWEKKNVKLLSLPVSNAAKLLGTTRQRWSVFVTREQTPVYSAVPA